MSKQQHNERGIMTIDASIALFFLVVIFYFALTTGMLMQSDVTLHSMATHTAKEMAHYGQLLTTIDDNENLLKGVLAVDQLDKDATLPSLDKHTATVFGQSFEMTHLLKELKQNRTVMQMFVKQLFKQYVPGKTDTQKTIHLKRLGVLGGLDGVHFSNSKLFQKNGSWHVQVALSCRLRGLYFQFLNYYHFIRHTIVVKIW